MRASMTTPKALARAAGVLYLLLAGAAALLIAVGGTAELCFLAGLLIKTVNAPAPGRQAPAIAQPGNSR